MLSFFLNIVEITVGISLLVLVMLLVLKLFGGKFTSKCRYVLWTLVLLRLAIPFSLNILPAIIEVPLQSVAVEDEQHNDVADDPVQSYVPEEATPNQGNVGTIITPGTVAPEIINPSTTDQNIPTNPSTPTNPTNPSTPTIEPNYPTVENPPIQGVVIPEPIPETPREPISIFQLLNIASIIYVVGAVIFFSWNMISYVVYTRRIMRSARIADAKTLSVLLSICEKENLKRVPTLLVSPEINSPAAFGIFRRKIVLPDITFTQNGLAGTLFHEVVHCKRGDLYIKVIELVARSLHWFNPLSHIAAVRCEMEMEMSCDETVLDGCNDDTRMAYGEVMLDIIRRCRRNKGALTTHFNPKKNSVKARFSNIINGSGNRRGKVLIPICLVLCIIAGTIVACTVGDDTPILKDYKINVLVDEELDGADGYNRDIHIIEVELDSEHEAEINETISAYFLDFYNEYMNSPGSAYDFPYQLIDTSYSVKNNILAITGVSRYSATSVPWSMVRSIFYDLENDKLCTVQEYFEATGLDIDKAEKQIDKTLQTHSQYEHLVWEISGVVYNEADELVLVVKVDNTNIDSEQIKYVYLIGYDFDEYCETNRDEHFDGFDEMVWQDIPIVISAEYPSDEFLDNYDESKIIDATSDEYAVYYVITSNVDVENTQITELIWNDSKLTDSVPLHKFDLKAGEPVVIMVSHPGAISNRALTYTDTFGVYRRFEITRSGEDGSPMFLEIQYSTLSDDFIGSDVEKEDETTPSVNVLSNPGGLDFKTIYIAYDNRYVTYEFDSDHILLMTYDVETGERGHVTATTDLCFYLVNTVRGEIVSSLAYGKVNGWLTSPHYEKDALVLYELNLDEETQTYSVPAALRIEYKNGQFSAQATEKDPWPMNLAMLVSPDGKYTVYNVSEDGVSHGGIDVVYPDGTVKRILTRVMLDDPDVYSLGGVTGYTPIQFIDNTKLLYHIGGWEWTKGYGIYDLATGENTEFRNGYGALGYADGYIYLREVRGYEPVAWYKATLDGDIQKIASVNEEEGVFRLQESRFIRFGGTDWRKTTGIYLSDYQNADGNAVVVKIYSLNINRKDNILAEVRYDTTDCEMFTISHGTTETVIVLADESLLPDSNKPVSENNPVTVFSNPKGYSVSNVYIPAGGDGSATGYRYSDGMKLYMTKDNVTDETGYVRAYTNIKLYLIDDHARIVGECAIDGEYRLDNISYETSGNGVVLRDVEYSYDEGYIVHGAFHILYSGGKLTATKIEADGYSMTDYANAFPLYDEPVYGNGEEGRYIAYSTTDDGVGRGGIDLKSPDGTVKRILSHLVFDDAGRDAQNVVYYIPVGFIDANVYDGAAKLVYNIGAYEGAGKGFGIYDTATGERKEFLYMNYRAIDVWSNSIYFEEYKRTDEGYSESYRIWKRDRNGNMMLLWSTDPADGEAYHEGESFPSFNNGLWSFTSYPDLSVPDYLTRHSTYVINDVRHGDNFDPIVTVRYPEIGSYTSYDSYTSNFGVSTMGQVTVVLPVPEEMIPPDVTSVEFETVDELVTKFAVEIDAFVRGTYERQEFLNAVDEFINPEKYRDTMTEERYAALIGMGAENFSATYDKRSGKMYLTFTVTGEPVGTLKKGENTAEVCENMYEELGVLCGDTSGNYTNEARSAVSKFLHWLGSNGMPESSWSEVYNFTDYMASCLRDIGQYPTRDLIVDYAARCFGISGYTPLESQFVENGSHLQIGYGLGVVNFIITSDTVENGVYTVTVDVYRDSYYYDKYQTVVFRITKLSDGAWKFIDAVEVSDTPLKETDTAAVLQSVLENRTAFYLSYSKETLFLSEYVERTEYSIKKYAILDMNGDGEEEMVLWFGHYNNDYLGFFVLHRDGDVVYAHGFPHRGMNGLTADGIHTSSGSASNHAVCKLEFNGSECTQVKLAYREKKTGATELSYYIGDKEVSAQEFEAYEQALFDKPEAEWIEYTGRLTNVDTTMLPAEKYYVPFNGDINKRQSFVLVSAYGENHGYAFGTGAPGYGEIWAVEDGVNYYVFATHSPFEDADNMLSDFKTYRVTSENRQIVSVEKVGTMTKELILKYGKPYSNAKLDGEYRAMSYSEDGTKSITVTVYNDQISCSSYLTGTDAGGTYTGRFVYEPLSDGTFEAYMSFTPHGSPASAAGETKRFYGKLYEYNGYVHFISESSAENPMPITFVIPDNSTDASFLTYTNELYGTDYSYSISVPATWYLYNGVFSEQTETNDAHKRAVLKKTEETFEEFKNGLESSKERDYVLYGVAGSTYSGLRYWCFYGDAEKPKGEMSRRWMFYIEADSGAYVLEVWERLNYDGKNYTANVVEKVARSVTINKITDTLKEMGYVIDIYERFGLAVRLPYFHSTDAGIGLFLKGVTYTSPDELSDNEIARFYQTYMMEKGLGHLYSIIRHTATEAFDSISYEKAVEYFAYDDTYFYGILRPTDVQYDTENESMRGEYEQLAQESDVIIKLFIDANGGLTQCSHNEAVNKITDDKLVIQRQFNPEEFASEIAKMSGRVVTDCGNAMGNSVYYYYPILLANDKQVTVYYTKDFGLSVYTTRAPLPEGIEFTYGKVVDAYHGNSGESIFVLRLENGDEVTFWYYMNFADEEVHEFELVGEITRENADLNGYTWEELLEKTSDIPLGFEPSSYKTEIELQTGKEVLFWHKIFSNPVYLYFVPCDTGTLEFTVYVYKDYSMVTNREGEGLHALKFTLPTDIDFDTAEVVWAGGGGGSGECRFIVRLTNGSTLRYIYYNNFHYETDILDFKYVGDVPLEDLYDLSANYPEIFGDIAHPANQ